MIRRIISGRLKVKRSNDGTIQELLDIRQPASRLAYTRYWESLGSVLKDGRLGSIVEVVRIQDPGVTFDLKGFAEFYGIENSRIFVEHCLPLSG